MNNVRFGELIINKFRYEAERSGVQRAYIDIGLTGKDITKYALIAGGPNKSNVDLFVYVGPGEKAITSLGGRSKTEGQYTQIKAASNETKSVVKLLKSVVNNIHSTVLAPFAPLGILTAVCTQSAQDLVHAINTKMIKPIEFAA